MILILKDGKNFIDAFRILKEEGFIKHYGISTDRIDVLKKFYNDSEGECVACECDYSLLNRTAEKEMFSFCEKNNIAVLTRGSLARGLLSGKYDLNTVFSEDSRKGWNVGGRNRTQYEQYMAKLERIKSICRELPLPQQAYRFVFSHPIHPNVVMGCTSIEQIKQNIKIASEYMDETIYSRLWSNVDG